MKLKDIQLFSSTLFLITILIYFVVSCGNKDKKGMGSIDEAVLDNTHQALNISIFLDLSDRLMRDNVIPSQMSRDTAIICNVLDYFKKQTLGPQILKSKNSIKVFFYPVPSHPQIVTLANDLSVDMASLNGKDKRIALENMKGKFQECLTQIYGKTISEQNWPGCDIWDFFSSKKVDIQCIRKGCRNILFILTDGYLYDANHKIEDGNAYSYILPQTLSNPNSSLIVKRDGLENLEVCILEVNPYNMKHKDQMILILEKWLLDMGIKKENLSIAETDVSSNIEKVITCFLEK